MRKLIKNSQNGDTIVEVLISLAVLSLVVGAAYAISSGALTASRQAQERSEATKIAESQIENLKANPADIPTASVPFCVSSTGAVVSWGTVPPAYESDDYSTYPNECKGQNVFYNVYITRTNKIHTVNVRWDRAGGGKDQLQMLYREYQP